MPDAVERFLTGYNPEIRDLALTLRKLVRRVAPDAEEKVHTAWKTIAYGAASPKGKKFCAIWSHRSFGG